MEKLEILKKLEEEIMAIERVLLQTIRFDLHVDHPYEILLKYAKVIKGDKEKVQKLVQMAWTFINDRYGFISGHRGVGGEAGDGEGEGRGGERGSEGEGWGESTN